MSSKSKRKDVVAEEEDASVQMGLTAQEQRQYLQHAVDEWGADEENFDDDIAPVEEIYPSQKAGDPAKNARQQLLAALNRPSLIIKTALAIAAAFALGWAPVQRFFASTSTEAVINAPLITLRATISGALSPNIAHLAAGVEVHSGQSIFTIVNRRATRGELNDLQREAGQLETNLMTLKAKRDALQGQRLKLDSIQKQYRRGRVQSLRKQITAMNAQIESAQAQRDESGRMLTRAQRLFDKGVASEDTLDKARRDAIVASRGVDQLEEQKGELEVALNFAEKGVFISDGYNDTPVSVQRLLDMQVELAGIDANITGATRQLEMTRRELQAERERHDRMAVTSVKASVSGRIWDLMVSAHEHVDAGQVLMRVLDCSDAHVTASVSKVVYQKLLIGQRATFTPDDGGPPVKGWIAGLDGLAVVRTNEAIQPNLLSRAPYHVTLDFPGLIKGNTCHVGRSGSVDFDTSDRTIRAIADIDGEG